jgi:hypothetical protein
MMENGIKGRGRVEKGDGKRNKKEMESREG